MSESSTGKSVEPFSLISPVLKVLLFTEKSLLNWFYFMLQWPNRPGSKFITGLALFQVKKLYLIYIYTNILS